MKKKAIYLTSLLSAALLFAGQANATYIMTLEQVGSNVVGTGSGTIDTTDLGAGSPISGHASISSSFGLLFVGAAGNGTFYLVSGPNKFGSGPLVDANIASGDFAGIDDETNGNPPDNDVVVVPRNYVSGTFLSGSATWDDTTLAGLRVTPGTYTWTWGSGADADSLTVYAGVPVPSATPEPASLLLLGGGLAALGMVRLRKSRNRQDCSIRDQHDNVPAKVKINPSEETIRIVTLARKRRIVPYVQPLVRATRPNFERRQRRAL